MMNLSLQGRILGVFAAVALLSAAGCVPDRLPTADLEHYEDVPPSGDTDKPDDGGGNKGDETTVFEPEVSPDCKDASVDCPKIQCQTAKCNAAGKCAYVAAGVKGVECDDGRICNGEKDQCNGQGKCEGTEDPKVVCNKGASECGVGKCKDDGTCEMTVNKGGQCTIYIGEGDNKKKHPCVTNSVCQEDGTCGGGLMLCPCLPPTLLYEDVPTNKKKKDSFWWSVTGSQGMKIEDFLCKPYASSTDACLGQLYCDTSAASWTCRTIPGTNKYEEPCPPSQNPCIENNCNKKNGECELILAPSTKQCDDGDACFVNDFCDGKGQCKGQVKICKCTPLTVKDDCAFLQGSDKCIGVYCDTSKGAPNFECKLNDAAKVNCSTNNDTVCKQNLCDPKEGKCNLTNVNEGKFVCDDGDPCIVNEGCFDGICQTKPGEKATNICPCTKNADCASKEDGNTCNGTKFCDEKTKECVDNPATIVNCPKANDTQCVKNFCYPSTGECKMTPSENIKKEIFLDDPKKNKEVPYPYPVYSFVSCDDGNVCTANDQCSNGVCKVGAVQLCDCKKDSDCIDDGDFCNGTPYCDLSGKTGKCKTNPATKVTCSSINDTQCALNECDKKTGQCALKPLNKDGVVSQLQPCTDGDPCTVGDICEKGKCVAGTNTCSCQADADCAAQGGGDKCLGTYFCAKGQKDKNGEFKANFCKINPKTKVICNSENDTECLANVCDKKTGKCGLTPVNQFQSCNDGDPCSGSPTCINGTCFSSVNLCQCTPQGNECAKFNSSNKCLPQYQCVGPAPFACKPVKSKPPCIGGDDCTTYACDPKDGDCKPKPKSELTGCNDGNPCTVGDTCAGKFDPGKTSAACESGPSVCQCAKDADCASFDDENACNGVVFCDKSDAKAAVCKQKPGTVVDCSASQPDKSSCFINKCDPATGKCANTTKPGACPDDGNPCTLEQCGKSSKCETVNAPDGTFAGVDTVSGKGLFCVAGKQIKAPDGMIYIPKGVFMMGCNETPDGGVFPANVEAAKTEGTACKGKADEQPQHQVELSAFWMGKHEITVKQYKACVDAGKCTAPDPKLADCSYNKWLAWQKDPTFKTVELEILSRTAVTCVDHANATAYCAWAADQDKVANADAGGLPTEAQWEYAAKGNCDTTKVKECGKGLPPYAWGFAPYPADCDSAWVAKTANLPCAVTETQPVGGRDKDTSVYGVQDVVGNAREWVADGYDAKFYGSAGATKKDAKAPLSGDAVIRGGSYLTKGGLARLTGRAKADKGKTDQPDVGFRCARLAK